MKMLKVGGYLKGHPEPIGEGLTLLFDDSGATLMISLRGLTRNEAKRIKSGRIDFALFEQDKIMFLLANIPGVIDWSDAPFHIGLYTDGRKIPDILEGKGLGLTIIGVDANDGSIMALRFVGLGTHISREMVRIMRMQKNDPTNQAAHGNRIKKIYSRYSCAQMVAESVARYTVGGRKQ